jgi:hypothetical protein
MKLKNYVSFLIEELMVSKLQLFSIYSFPHVLLDPHKNFHVGKGLTKIVFILFKCEIMMYIFTHVF